MKRGKLTYDILLWELNGTQLATITQEYFEHEISVSIF